MYFFFYIFIDFIEYFFFVKLVIIVNNVCLCYSYLYCNFLYYFKYLKNIWLLNYLYGCIFNIFSYYEKLIFF